MTERPILFNADMVRAILEGRKTQTRRVLKPGIRFAGCVAKWQVSSSGGMDLHISGTPCDRFWVRETWGLHSTEPADGPEGAEVYYRATQGDLHSLRYQLWRPSIFMPRWASRISLKLTQVRVVRLQDISEEDAKAEGIGLVLADSMPEIGRIMIDKDRRAAFAHLWDSINGKRPGCSWKDNPWLWAVDFERATP